MTRLEALEIVMASIEKATKQKPEGITEMTDLIDDGIIDSLDSMTILFEMEDISGKKLNIDDEYNDYKVSSLVDLVLA